MKLPLADKKTFATWSTIYFVVVGLICLVTFFVVPLPPLSPRLQAEVDAKALKEKLDKIECCEVINVYSFNADSFQLSPNSQITSGFYDKTSEQILMTVSSSAKTNTPLETEQPNSSPSTKLMNYNTINKQFIHYEEIPRNIIYFFEFEPTNKGIIRSLPSIATESSSFHDWTQQLSTLIGEKEIKAVYLSAMRDQKSFYVLDSSNTLYNIDSKATKVLSYYQQESLEDSEVAQIGVINQLLFVLDKKSHLHVIKLESGKLLQSIDLADIVRLGSLTDKEEKINHPTLLAINEIDKMLYVSGANWNGIYGFRLREHPRLQTLAEGQSL